jgi:hypothetical protein
LNKRLKAEGVPVGDVARIAGHKSAAMRLSFYTHSMQSGDEAAKALDDAFSMSRVTAAVNK